MSLPTATPSSRVLHQNPPVLLGGSPGSTWSAALYCYARLSGNCHMFAPQLQGVRDAEEPSDNFRRRCEGLSQIISLWLAFLHALWWMGGGYGWNEFCVGRITAYAQMHLPLSPCSRCSHLMTLKASITLYSSFGTLTWLLCVVPSCTLNAPQSSFLNVTFSGKLGIVPSRALPPSCESSRPATWSTYGRYPCLWIEEIGK